MKLSNSEGEDLFKDLGCGIDSKKLEQLDCAIEKIMPILKGFSYNEAFHLLVSIILSLSKYIKLSDSQFNDLLLLLKKRFTKGN